MSPSSRADQEQSSHLLHNYKERSPSLSSTSTLEPEPESPTRVLFDEKEHGLKYVESEEEEEVEDIESSQRTQRKPWKYSLRTGLQKTKNTTTTLLVALIPSFLRSSTEQTPAKLHPTAYLDGLRGVAAFFVFIHHFILDWYPALSWGYGSEPAQTWFFQLPLLRIIYSGRGMVALFFVISGYVLSYKTLRQMRRREFEGVLETLTSSVFRRGIRLFLPISISTFLSLLIVRGDWYVADPQRHNLLPARLDSFWAQLADWLTHLGKTVNPFQVIDARNLYGNPYDGHLWTIPIEFRGSIVVFLTLLGLAKTTQRVRFPAMLALSIYALYVTHWDLYLFLTGMGIAELDWILSSSSGDSLPHSHSATRASRVRSLSRYIHTHKSIINALWTLPVFLLGIHLLSYPDIAGPSTPGYMFMTSSLTPEAYSALIDPAMTQRYWLSIGAFLCVLSLSFSPTLQLPFVTRFAQYLGNISFALYMVHGPVLYTVGMRVLYKALEAGEIAEGDAKFTQWFLVAVVVNSVLCFWLADVFWRAVDRRSVWVSQVVKGACWVK